MTKFPRPLAAKDCEFPVANCPPAEMAASVELTVASYGFGASVSFGAVTAIDRSPGGTAAVCASAEEARTRELATKVAGRRVGGWRMRCAGTTPTVELAQARFSSPETRRKQPLRHD